MALKSSDDQSVVVRFPEVLIVRVSSDQWAIGHWSGIQSRSERYRIPPLVSVVQIIWYVVK